MSTSSQLCSLAEGVICKVQEMGKLCKVKNDYIKWIKYLNRTIAILRKYIRFNVSAVNKKHFLKLESSVSLLRSFKEQFNHRKNISESKKRYLMWIDLESCFEKRIRTGAIVNLSVKDPVEFFTRARRSFICKVKKELQRSLLKVNVIFLAKFIKPSGEEDIKHFQTKNRVIDHNTDLNIYYDDHIQNNILNKLEEFQERDSGWSLYEIIQLKINFNISSFYYPNDDNDNGDDDDGDIQMELSKNMQNFKAFYHFALIKDLSRLVRRQTTDLNNKRFYCDRCLNHFYSQESLNKHIFTCRKMNKTKITPPSGDEKFISFSDFKNKHKVPFVIYADLETILKDYKDSNTGTIKKYQKHIPCSIAYYLLCTYDNSRSKFNLFTGKDCITWFVKQLQQLAIDLNSIFSHEVNLSTNENLIRSKKHEQARLGSTSFVYAISGYYRLSETISQNSNPAVDQLFSQFKRSDNHAY
nr:unnamed protein product [Callosobruchus analis]